MSDVSDRIQHMLQQFEEQARKATELQSAIQDLHGSAQSPDGSVSVTVAPSGAILNLQLSPNAMRQSHTALQQSIMTAIGQATQKAAEQLNDTVAPVLGDQFPQFQEAFNAQSATPLRFEQTPADAPSGSAQPNQGQAPRNQRRSGDLDDGDDFANESFLR